MKTPERTSNTEHRTLNIQGVRPASPLRCSVLNVGCWTFPLLLSAFSSFAAETPQFSSGAKLVPHDPKVFRPDPVYPAGSYSAEEQLKIYGDKRAVPTTRPLLELGRELYREGPFQPGLDVLGRKNLVFANLLVSGDWRSAVAHNDVGNREFTVAATRLNLDVDLRFTGTERIHAFFRPLDANGRFTRYEFGKGKDTSLLHLDGTPDALFFEGDLGAIGSGLTGKDAQMDLPFTFGLIPLLFQNGVWMEDAFVGAAFSIPARNSRLLDFSNFDLTFFAGFDKLSSPAFVNAGRPDDSDGRIYGVAAFVETMGGYWEAGYAYLDGVRNQRDAGYHNLTAAFTRRYFNRVSNSIRVIGNVGQDSLPGGRTADGVLLLVENSLITSLPSTLVPYFNLFAGFNRPQSAARDAGAGGPLKNTGILFETDGLTGFPTLDSSANKTYGGALGLEYLFNLNQQLVVEAAVVRTMGGDNDPGRIAQGDQYGVGIRYQRPLNHSWIIRADAMIGWRQADTEVSGVRVELRAKF